jgi:hypothetical protein
MGGYPGARLYSDTLHFGKNRLPIELRRKHGMNASPEIIEILPVIGLLVLGVSSLPTGRRRQEFNDSC